MQKKLYRSVPIMATASMELTTFRESPQSAWGKKWRPGSKPGGVADTLLDAVPPAQKSMQLVLKKQRKKKV